MSEPTPAETLQKIKRVAAAARKAAAATSQAESAAAMFLHAPDPGSWAYLVKKTASADAALGETDDAVDELAPQETSTLHHAIRAAAARQAGIVSF
jgi:hypothetical protein